MNIEKYYKIINNEKIQCLLCPNLCTIKEEEQGLCFIKKNQNNQLINTSYSKFVALAMDPVEKKPFFHFYPGKQILSLGSLGCNFRCIHCQNWDIAQPDRLQKLPKEKSLSPENIIAIAKEHSTDLIAFTYNEPLINFEYILETAKLAKTKGLKVCLVTNGFINTKPLMELMLYIDAYSIDLKAFSTKAYKKLTGINAFNQVKTNIKLLTKHNKLVELTTNIVTGINDDLKTIQDISNWIYDLNKYTPWHITTFRPMLELKDAKNIPYTFIIEATSIANKSGLKYVYSNIQENTYCSHCEFLLISRKYFSVTENKIRKDALCPNCNKSIQNICL